MLASLDLFDANYRTGQEVTTDLHLIKDSWHDANIHVDLLLIRECPEYIPEAECFDLPVRKWSFDFATKADSIEKKPVTWRLPDEEGGGRILFAQLDLQRRVDLSKTNYDPAAERTLLNLLGE